MKIGNIEIKGRAVLAPMAGVTDRPFRELCARQGACLTYTEMISAKALYYKNRNTEPLLSVGKDEGPVGVQLFGNDPELMADEAAKLAEKSYDFFDINMGCPVPKVVNNGEGSALMRDLALISRIVSEMVKRQPKPVTVKIRKGFDASCINAVEAAKTAEDAGAAAIAVHGRLREEYYRGKADWDIIRQVKEAVKIPVIGSGDIFSPEDIKRMLEETGVDAVMVARGARGNPWIFAQFREYMETGRMPQKPSKEEVKDMLLEHLKMQTEFLESFDTERKRGSGNRKLSAKTVALRQMRAHAGWYSQGYHSGAVLRREINQAETIEDFEDALKKWVKS